MSGGRVELGLGAGWYEQEHEAYAIPFPALGERFDRLEEQLAVITGLWSTPVGGRFSLQRRALPGRPTRRRCPSRCRPGACRSSSAAAGPKRTPALAARYAAEYNIGVRVRRSLRASSGRGSSTRARRSTATRRRSATPRPPSCASAPTRPSTSGGRRRSDGNPTSCGATASPARPTRSWPGMQRWSDAGAERLYLQVLDLADLDHLEPSPARLSALTSRCDVRSESRDRFGRPLHESIDRRRARSAISSSAMEWRSI